MQKVLQLRRLLIPHFAAASTCGGGGSGIPHSLITIRHRLRLGLCHPSFFWSSITTHREVMAAASNQYTFGPYKIDEKEVFYSTDLSYAMVNLRPLVPGHILFVLPGTYYMTIHFASFINQTSLFVGDLFGDIHELPSDSEAIAFVPLREVKRFVDLTATETSDLWLTAQEVGGKLEKYHKSSSLTFAIQDGPQAGQTVPHVHIHILPRRPGDFEKNDEVYDAIDVKEKELAEKLDLDKDRKDRTLKEMTEEADIYRKLFT